MTADLHIVAVLDPCAWAHQILDAAREGEPITDSLIDTALVITGDIKALNEERTATCNPNEAPRKVVRLLDLSPTR